MHGYQRVQTADDDPGDPRRSLSGDVPLQDLNSVNANSISPPPPPFPSIKNARKASVYRLLPYFFLSSLSWGITMVPRVNVLVSLICQQVTESDENGDALRRRHEMDSGMGSGGASESGKGGSFTEACSAPEVLAGVAFLSIYRDLITGILGAVMSFYLGKLSDRIGRVKIMALNGHVLLMSELVFLLVVAFPDTLNFRWLFLSFALDGLSGSFPLLMATAASYVTDTTTDDSRIMAMGWLQGGMLLGMAAGPALGTALGQLTVDQPAAIFLWAVICHAVGLLCLLLLPESRLGLHKAEAAPESPVFDELDHSTHNHRDHHHHSFLDQAHGHDHGHFAPAPHQSFASYLRFTLSMSVLDSLFDSISDPAIVRRSRRNLILLLIVTAIMFGCSVGSMDVLMVYPQARFQWDMMMAGNFISIVNTFRTLSATLCLRVLMIFLTRGFRGAFSTKSKTHPQNDEPAQQADDVHQKVQFPLLRLALFSDLLGYVGFALAPSGLAFTAAGVLSSLSALGVSVSQTSMTMLVSREHVGKLMGTVGSVQAVTRLVGPPAVNFVYGWTVSAMPQAVFLMLAIATSTGLALTYMLRM